MSRRDHILQLASKYDLNIVLETSVPPKVRRQNGYDWGGYWIPKELTGRFWFDRVWQNEASVVYGFNARKPITYWVALHELGHQALGQVRRNRDPEMKILRDEADAWIWAFEHSKEPPSDTTLHHILFDSTNGYGSYIATSWLGREKALQLSATQELYEAAGVTRNDTA